MKGRGNSWETRTWRVFWCAEGQTASLSWHGDRESESGSRIWAKRNDSSMWVPGKWKWPTSGSARIDGLRPQKICLERPLSSSLHHPSSGDRLWCCKRDGNTRVCYLLIDGCLSYRGSTSQLKQQSPCYCKAGNNKSWKHTARYTFKHTHAALCSKLEVDINLIKGQAIL